MTTTTEQHAARSRQQTLAILDDLKEKKQDFEWYPTTEAMLAVICADWRKVNGRYGNNVTSVLDIGCGDGRALTYFGQHLSAHGTPKLLGIEKSAHLAGLLPRQVLILGSDFAEQTLFDKEVSFTFSNPPYSEFRHWMLKILTESRSEHVYMIVPQRWQADPQLAAVIEARKIDVRVVQEFDFLGAHRQARARVHLLHARISHGQKDAFKSYVERTFSELYEKQKQTGEAKAEREEKRATIVTSGGSLVEALVGSYTVEMQGLHDTFEKVGTLDAELLEELHVDCASIAEILYGRIQDLKKVYWKLLFENLKMVTDRLTSKHREEMLNTLLEHTHIDFTRANIALIVGWIARHANDYLVKQVKDVFEDLIDKVNVRGYKSNSRVFCSDEDKKQNKGWGSAGFRFREEFRDGKHTHIKLDYRLVIENQGGINTSDFCWEARHGLDVRAYTFLQDIITAAWNLGFAPATQPSDYEWTSGMRGDFMTAEGELLFEAKAFKNGNIHLRLSKELALALNVEYGRLRGWVLSAEDAAEELQDPEAVRYWGKTLQLEPGKGLLQLPG